jgi:hypothetical protein
LKTDDHERSITLIYNDFKILLEDKKYICITKNIDPLVFQYFVISNYVELVKILIKKIKFPEDENNYAILKSYEKNYVEMTNILWNDKRVKSTLQKDNLELYNKLTIENIKNKTINF